MWYTHAQEHARVGTIIHCKPGKSQIVLRACEVWCLGLYQPLSSAAMQSSETSCICLKYLAVRPRRLGSCIIGVLWFSIHSIITFQKKAKCMFIYAGNVHTSPGFCHILQHGTIIEAANDRIRDEHQPWNSKKTTRGPASDLFYLVYYSCLLYTSPSPRD